MQDCTRNATACAIRAARSGFTLIELLLVIAILGTLASVVMNNFAGQGEQSKVTATRTSIANIGTALQAFEVTAGKFPDSLDELTVATESRAALLKKDNLADSWGNPFQYKKTSKFEYEIRSAGPDGQMNTEDDIFN